LYTCPASKRRQLLIKTPFLEKVKIGWIGSVRRPPSFFEGTLLLYTALKMWKSSTMKKEEEKKKADLT